MKKLGRLEKVDLLELWNGEDADFTAWLSQEDNIAEVGNLIGMELEVQKQHRNPICSMRRSCARILPQTNM